MSKKPSKSRKEQYTLPKHKASKNVKGHLSEKLRKEIGKRAISLRKGDTVKIVRGGFAGKEAKITRIERSGKKLYLEKIVKKKSNGQEWQVPIDASKVIVVDFEKTDGKRFTKGKGVKK